MKKLTFRALALRQSYWNSFDYICILVTMPSVFTFLVGIFFFFTFFCMLKKSCFWGTPEMLCTYPSLLRYYRGLAIFTEGFITEMHQTSVVIGDAKWIYSRWPILSKVNLFGCKLIKLRNIWYRKKDKDKHTTLNTLNGPADTASSIYVVGSKPQAYKTRPKGNMGS